MAPRFTRREFVQMTVAVGTAAALTACPRITGKARMVFKRSGYHKKVSNAAKSHNANFLYSDRQVAVNNPAHPGDRSKVVWLMISEDRYNQLFPFLGSPIVDLRKV